MTGKICCGVLTLFLSALLIVSAFLAYRINGKLNLLIEFDKVRQFPTGEFCRNSLGQPAHILNGDDDYSWYQTFTHLKDRAYLKDKVIYLWPAPMFHYFIFVVEKSSDKVVLVTLQPM